MVIVFIGPSGIGKSFTVASLISRFPSQFACVKVYTNRPPRSSERNVVDRVFVSNEEFERIVQAGEFAMHEDFAGNRYGYRAADFQPSGRHLVLNAPPFFVPKLLQTRDMLVVGLQASPNHMALLDTRMQARGDSPQTRAARKPFIEQDIRELDAMLPLINKRGKVFHITSDRTVPDQVIPWIMQTVGIAP